MAAPGARSVLHKWMTDYCSPVVITVTTAEAENVCLKNGLLLHELISAFGHLEGVNSSIRAGNVQLPVSDAHIRFERATEVKAKISPCIEEALLRNFEAYPAGRMPINVSELKTSPPTAWSENIEQIAMRSFSFSEFEMMSHPFIILTVVATTDADPVGCMQELSSQHHVPTCLSTGQFYPDIHRVFLVLHDTHDCKHIDAVSVHRKVQARFPPTHTKLLCINSLSQELQNLQQPDMWSLHVTPLFFPQHAPVQEASLSSRPINPVTGAPVCGSRLSLEDFMALREFCLNLFHQELLPCFERRLGFLTKLVSDARKGVKNVLKSFWRKTTNDVVVPKTGTIRYKCDRIEAQTLLLADMSFMMKDYENAISLYKLARDDFKSDKATMHLAHALIMITACNTIADNSRCKEITLQLEAIMQLVVSCPEAVHYVSYFAMLSTEICMNMSVKGHLDAAQFLLQAAGCVSRHPIMCGLLTERASVHLLQGGHSRKYILYQALAGQKFKSCGERPAKHAAICYFCALLFHDKSRWGFIRAKLSNGLVENYKVSGQPEDSQRALVMMIRTLRYVLMEDMSVGGKEAMSDAVNIVKEIMGLGSWGSVTVGEGWVEQTTRQLLLDALPLVAGTSDSTMTTEISGLPIPEINKRLTALVIPLNGMNVGSGQFLTQATTAEIEELSLTLEAEKTWGLEQEKIASATNPASDRCLSDMWVEVENVLLAKASLANSKSGSGRVGTSSTTRITLGEHVILRAQFRNKLPVNLTLSNLQIELDPPGSFSVTPVELRLSPRETKEILLYATPVQVGSYRIDAVCWNLSDTLKVREPLKKDGPLLQRSLQQRVERLRGPDTSFSFTVTAPYPLLSMAFEGLSSEVLQGQLLKTTLLLRNDGASPACEIYLKLSQPYFAFFIGSRDISASTVKASSSLKSGLLDCWGQSSTVVRLPTDIVIAPMEELRLEAWLKLTGGGKQNVSVLASYKALRENGVAEIFEQGQASRTSFVSMQTCVLPSISIGLRVVAKPSSTSDVTVIADIANLLSKDTSLSNRDSSVGQLELDDSPSEFDSLQEGGCKIEGIWMIGSGELHVNADIPSKDRVLSMFPKEHLVLCLPIRLNDNNSGHHKRAFAGKCSWLAPLALSRLATVESETGHECPVQLTSVIERYLCMAAATERLRKEITASRKNFLSEAAAQEGVGPRTIAQVRRDRQKELLSEGKDDDSDCEDLTTVSLSDNVTVQHSRSCRGISLSVQDLADAEAKHGHATVVVVWVCRWQGKIRRGIHFASHVSLLTGNNLLTAVKKKLPASHHHHHPAISDLLLVGISHAQHVKISVASAPSSDEGGNSGSNSSGSTRGVLVPVELELRSASADTELIVSVEVVDRRDRSSSASSASSSSAENNLGSPSSGGAVAIGSSSSSSSSSAEDALSLAISRASSRGLQWQCKTKYMDIRIAPNQVIKLPFQAAIARPGIYDLKRFKIFVTTARAQVEKSNAPVLKIICGQSLMEVE